MSEIEKTEEPNVQHDFEFFEDKKIKESEEQKIQWFGESNLSIRQRIYQFVATVIMVAAKNFMGKINWQIGLVVYLGVVCPVGTWTAIKWIVNLF